MAKLLANGHPLEAVIDDYTADELSVHYKAAVRRESDELRKQTVMMRNAMHAQRRDIRQFLQQLSEMGRESKKQKAEVGSLFGALGSLKAVKHGEHRGTSGRNRDRSGDAEQTAPTGE